MLLPMKSALVTSDVILLLRKRKEASRRDRGMTYEIAKCFGRTNVIPIKWERRTWNVADLEQAWSSNKWQFRKVHFTSDPAEFVTNNVILFFTFLQRVINFVDQGNAIDRSCGPSK